MFDKAFETIRTYKFTASTGVISAVLGVLVLVAMWKIFQKAGEKGWKCIIPVYGEYVMYRFSWNTGMFWLMLIFAIGTCLSGVSAFLAGICVIGAAVMSIIFDRKLARSFGKGFGFTLGLIFLAPIFLMILGFGSASYIGPDGKKA